MGILSGLILVYYVAVAAVAVLVIWALVLTIQLLRSVLAERRAREATAPLATLDR
jgi:heme exporter protein D